MAAEISGGVNVRSPSCSWITDSLPSAQCGTGRASVHPAHRRRRGPSGVSPSRRCARVRRCSLRAPRSPTMMSPFGVSETTLGTMLVAILTRNTLGSGQVHEGDQAVRGAEIDPHDLRVRAYRNRFEMSRVICSAAIRAVRDPLPDQVPMYRRRFSTPRISCKHVCGRALRLAIVFRQTVL